MWQAMYGWALARGSLYDSCRIRASTHCRSEVGEEEDGAWDHASPPSRSPIIRRREREEKEELLGRQRQRSKVFFVPQHSRSQVQPA